MEILLADIPDGGLEISRTNSDPWVSELLSELLGGAYNSVDSIEVKASIHLCGNNINVEGSVKYSSHYDCDRCLKNFCRNNKLDFHATLIPAAQRRKPKDDQQEIELSGEDLEFGYYEGDRFDLSQIIKEQIILADTIQHICSESCKGLCTRCGKDLNTGKCECKQDETDPRWSALKGVKIDTTSH